MNKWGWIFSIAIIVIFVTMCGFLFICIDSLTYGGLFKNETWYEIRKLWNGNG